MVLKASVFLSCCVCLYYYVIYLRQLLMTDFDDSFTIV